ncbi:MAG: elongation factor G [Thermodesulfobacteriota bacterium]
MKYDINKVRNIGISAHIDSGKTTLTERILYFTKRIHAIHEVRGKDGVGATMDSMELEKERGITIASAATFCEWKDCQINIIDTPGHVDFTIEVERSLRVLDGGILVLCSVGGVQSQSITVDQQMKRYQVPCIAFVNKCDRTGADPFRVISQLREKLGHNAIAIQIPIGLEDSLEGVIDLVAMKAYYFEGPHGDELREAEIPSDLLDHAQEKREELIDEASMFSDELTEAILEDTEVTEEMLINAIKAGTLTREMTPVMMGSAFKNKGIQKLLDAVNMYLPNPTEVVNEGLDLDKNEEVITLPSDTEKEPVALAFKLEDGVYGQLTYLRVYQGSVKKGDTLYNTRTKKKLKIGRLVRMHADQMEDITEIPAGMIGAIFGVECASGDTFCSSNINVSMTSMYIPKPVISLSVTPKDNKAQVNMSKALQRFTREDPTFKTYVDDESGETIVQGMGELHLEVYIERMKREYKAEIETGKPRVAYREAITKMAEFNYTHKKQTGGAGQFGRVAGYIEPIEEDFEFIDHIKGGVIPTQYIPSCEAGFKECLAKGPRLEFPVTGVRVVLNDGAYHSVDSSEMAFKTAARDAFLDVYFKAKPTLLEPIMKVVVESPGEFQGNVIGILNQRRGIIKGVHEEGPMCTIEAETPLSEMFGYSTELRSSTQGKAQFTMEFGFYKKAPQEVIEEVEEEIKKRQENKK